MISTLESASDPIQLPTVDGRDLAFFDEGSRPVLVA